MRAARPRFRADRSWQAFVSIGLAAGAGHLPLDAYLAYLRGTVTRRKPKKRKGKR